MSHEAPVNAQRSDEEHTPVLPPCRRCESIKLIAQPPDSSDSETSTILNIVLSENTEPSPILEHFATGRYSHTKLVREKQAHQPTSNDPFDYEQKYPPDEENKEMSETGRVFKTYMDECTKYDFNMVENWRDGLDMLLVFAALFSAVVTTFVVQTCQDLRVDYSQVTATLMLRMMDIQLAIAQGKSSEDLPHNSDPAASFRPKTLDLWVNGLWFTSLGLSLTTALITVLTKQWILQYMSISSGTPRYRTRIRQFRFASFQKWHIPLMIGLLPVLMHMSLGVFCIGLVLYLYSLSGAIAAVLGIIAGLAFSVYFSTNLLPLFFADCPYKTPLSHYIYAMVGYVRRRFSPKQHDPQSLKDVEGAAVSRKADNLDALAVSWLHNTSSNDTVQSIAVQALASLPLKCISIITGPDGVAAPVSDSHASLGLDLSGESEATRPAVIRAIRSHHQYNQPLDRLERFQRAAMRFGKFVMLSDKPDKYAFIYNKSPVFAMKVMIDNLLGLDDAKATFDVVFWGKIFEAALRSDLSFLNIASTHGDGRPSRVWSALLACAVRDHDCKLSNCDGKEENLFTYTLGPEGFPLVIHHYDLEKNGTSRKLSDALSINMRSSFVSWVLHVCFPSVSGTMAHLPKDIILVLTLLNTRSVQHTSSALGTTSATSLFRQVLERVEDYVQHAAAFPRHRDVDSTALTALKVMVESEAFGTSTVIALSDEMFAVQILFRGLNRHFELSDRDPSWLTRALFHKIWRVVSASHESGAIEHSWEIVAQVFTYVSHFDTHLFATEEVYSYLVNKSWLDDIGAKLARLSKSITPDVDALPYLWCPGYMYVAGTYVDVLYTHAASASKVLDDARDYARTPAHLSTLSKILLLADCDTQDKLWRLAKVVQVDSSCWSECIKDLTELITCPGAENAYTHVCSLVNKDVHGNPNIFYHPFKELHSLIATFAMDMARCQYTPPTCARPENLKSQALASSPQDAGKFWTHCRTLFGHVLRAVGL